MQGTNITTTHFTSTSPFRRGGGEVVYTPFGMQMGFRGKNAVSGEYRFGFNGKGNDNEVKGNGNQQDYGFRIYDPRLGRFFSVDPLTKYYPWYTPYQFAGNTPIQAIDLDGLEPWNVNQTSTTISNETITDSKSTSTTINKGIVYGPYKDTQYLSVQ